MKSIPTIIGGIIFLLLAGYCNGNKCVQRCPQHSNNCSFAIDYTNDVFLLDDKEFRYISGSFHYFRTRRCYWRDRFRTMKQAGLNVVCTYIEWSLHAPSPNTFYFEGDADIEYFIECAAEEGLYVILRPGPYICAEREFGGLPWWLLALYPDINIRTSDKNYLHEVEKWFNVLFKRLVKYLRGNCGPVILIQVENEYGSFYACDMEYKLFLKNLILRYVHDKAVLFTTDFPEQYTLRCGYIPGCYATVDFGTDFTNYTAQNAREAFAIMRKFSPRGPLVNSEFYPGRLSRWNAPAPHIATSKIVNSMREFFKLKACFNFYMFYGGTNFGFSNGANFVKLLPSLYEYEPEVSSYDFGAPMDEAGDPTPVKYFAIRDIIAKEGYFKSLDNSTPRRKPKGRYGTVVLKAVLSIFNTCYIKDKITRTCREPRTFEELGVNYGYVLYETTLPENISDPAILEARCVSDRGLVYLDKCPSGVLSRTRRTFTIPLIGKPGRKLSILVENQGRINFGNITRDTKGLLCPPLLNNRPLYGWKMTGLPFKDVSWVHELSPTRHKIYPPALYRGEFTLPCNMTTPLDSYIDPSKWGKGVIFINECHLGRYWPAIGPQVTVYVPGCCLRAYPRKNVIVVFETEYTPKGKKTMKFVDKASLDKQPPAA